MFPRCLLFQKTSASGRSSTPWEQLWYPLGEWEHRGRLCSSSKLEPRKTIRSSRQTVPVYGEENTNYTMDTRHFHQVQNNKPNSTPTCTLHNQWSCQAFLREQLVPKTMRHSTPPKTTKRRFWGGKMAAKPRHLPKNSCSLKRRCKL